MDRTRPTLNQVNIVSGDLDASIAFYRKLGVEIPDHRVWVTASGPHHAGAESTTALELDSATYARIWNTAWRDTGDLAGRVVVGFGVESRQDVDRIYGEMTAAGHRGCSPLTMRPGAPATPWSKIPMAWRLDS